MTTAANSSKPVSLIYLKKAAIFGSGAFGTALSCVLAKKCDHVDVWHIDASEARQINSNRGNKRYLPGVRIADNVKFSANVEEVFTHARLIVFAIPTQYTRAFLKDHGALMWRYVSQSHVSVLVCSEGMERGTMKFPAQIVEEFFPNYPISVMGGPSFAIEVAKGMLTNVCIASNDIYEARTLQSILTTGDRSFRCWSSADTIGCQVSGAMKNILAIAAGVASGLKLGYDARAALITRGLVEICAITSALGGTGNAIFGLSGLGDLFLTCSSEMSRNFTVGEKIGRGMSLVDAMGSMTAVAEGVNAAEPLYHLGKSKNVNMKITGSVYDILYKNVDIHDALKSLVDGPLADEGLPSLRPSKL